MSKQVIHKRNLKTRIIVVIIALIFISLCVAFGIKVASNYESQKEIEISENNQTQVEYIEEKVVPKDTTINLVAIGDIMCHKTNFKAAYDAKTGTYDFSPVFANIAKYITKADIAIRELRNYLCRSNSWI